MANCPAATLIAQGVVIDAIFCDTVSVLLESWGKRMSFLCVLLNKATMTAMLHSFILLVLRATINGAALTLVSHLLVHNSHFD